MANGTEGPRTRLWADVVAIVVGVALLGIGIWPSDVTASRGAERELGSPDVAMLARWLGGALAVGGVLIAQRWRRRRLGRTFLIVAALVLLAAFASARDFGWRAWFTLALPAALLLAAAFAAGPMPAPSADAGGPWAR
jgi:hypothetical protein